MVPGKIGKYSRSVSIIGVGAMPFGDTGENPELKGLTEGEFFGAAALMAMENAGIEPRDIDFFYHGSANPKFFNNAATPNMQVAEWFGVRGKGSVHHSEACCTGYVGLEQAVNDVASGAHEIVLSGCVEMACGLPVPGKPAHLRKKITTDDVTPDLEYLRSPFNPKTTQYLRVTGNAPSADGSACVIVCPTEMAHQFKQKPIEVLGVGTSCLELMRPHNEMEITREAGRQVYEATGLRPEDIDLLLVNDFVLSSQLLAAEELGYLPKGEGWKWVLEGRTAFDGDRPINPHGGRTSYGHAYGASGMADIYEAVLQLRGQAGPRQIKKNPKTAMLRGFGGGQNCHIPILRVLE